MKSFEPRDYLRHILAELDYLILHAQDLNIHGFLKMKLFNEHLCEAWRLLASGETSTRRLSQSTPKCGVEVNGWHARSPDSCILWC